MPELPEVEIVVRSLNTILKNKTITGVEVLKPKMIKEINVNNFCNELISKTIAKVTRYGKFIVFHLSNNLVMLSHLRMEGKYYFYKSKTKKAKHTYVVFNFSDGSELHYDDTRMFGTFHLRTEDDYLSILPLSKLAKEPEYISANDIHKTLSKKTIAIKTALLDQTLVSGLGNIYVDEVLFKSKIHPKTQSKKITLKQVKDILFWSDKIMKRSIELGGSSIRTYRSLNSKAGEYQNELKVHTRVNQDCFDCKSKIEKIKVNGRGTYFCPKCQKHD